jgi:hypothetical protein
MEANVLLIHTYGVGIVGEGWVIDGVAFTDTAESLLFFFGSTPLQLSNVCCPHALCFLHQFHVLLPTSFVVSPGVGATFFMHALDPLDYICIC